VGDFGDDADEAPPEFLSRLGADLMAQPEVDADLASILIAHILNVSPAAECVTSARTAISNLAKTRAAPAPKGSKDA
jgi:hypothetical protein